MQTPHGYLKQRRSKLKGAQALGHMAQQSGCWHEVSRSALDMDPGPNRGTRRWSCGLRAVGTWTEKGGKWKPNLERGQACVAGGVVVANVYLHLHWWPPAESAGRRVRVTSGALAGLISSPSHPPRRSGDLGAKPKLQHSAVEALWSLHIVSVSGPIRPRLGQAQPPACIIPLADRPIQGWAVGSSMRRQEGG
jgi:hypothetical protein